MIYIVVYILLPTLDVLHHLMFLQLVFHRSHALLIIYFRTFVIFKENRVYVAVCFASAVVSSLRSAC